MVAARYVAAYSSVAPEGSFVVSRDGRASGRMFSDVIRATLSALGRDVIDADVAATPTTGILVEQYKAAGGIQISASHNPAPYNGLKLFGADGRVVSQGVGETVLVAYENRVARWVPHDRLGTIYELHNTTTEHLKKVLRIVDPERIKLANYAVLLDSNHGAGAILGCELLESLGCAVTLLGSDPTGEFAHVPEPTEENLMAVAHQVANAELSVGFCQDPDADRLALIDENGRYVGEEYTLAICLQHVLKSRKGPVVTNCSTSRMAEDLANQAGVPFYRSKVGEANVSDLMQTHDAVFGGEGNGGPIDPQVGYVRDSFVAMALVLDAMAESGKPLSQLVDELPRYAICKSKVALPTDAVAKAVQRLKTHFDDATASELDGLRLDWNDRWLLIRASNTEPIVRVIAEAPTEEQAQQLCATSEQILCE